MEEERSRRDILIHRNSDATQSIQYRDLLSMNLDMFQSPAPIVESVGSPPFSIPQWTPEMASEALPALPAAQSNEECLERSEKETPPPEMEGGRMSPALSLPPFQAKHCHSMDLDLSAIPVVGEAPKTDDPDAAKSL